MESKFLFLSVLMCVVCVESSTFNSVEQPDGEFDSGTTNTEDKVTFFALETLFPDHVLRLGDIEDSSRKRKASNDFEGDFEPSPAKSHESDEFEEESDEFKEEPDHDEEEPDDDEEESDEFEEERDHDEEEPDDDEEESDEFEELVAGNTLESRLKSMIEEYEQVNSDSILLVKGNILVVPNTPELDLSANAVLNTTMKNIKTKKDNNTKQLQPSELFTPSEKLAQMTIPELLDEMYKKLTINLEESFYRINTMQKDDPRSKYCPLSYRKTAEILDGFEPVNCHK
eukprot:GHVL01017396.1.p1 GENE.GHVL01017396.1~~GHVL01017396.1.p1  ORF type:complete len:285 (+),score=71.37 GHVL01017396.1:32-886(+)